MNCVVVEDPVVQRLVVFLEARGGEQSQLAGNLPHELVRFGNPHRRMGRVDVDRLTYRRKFGATSCR